MWARGKVSAGAVQRLVAKPPSGFSLGTCWDRKELALELCGEGLRGAWSTMLHSAVPISILNEHIPKANDFQQLNLSSVIFFHLGPFYKQSKHTCEHQQIKKKKDDLQTMRQETMQTSLTRCDWANVDRLQQVPAEIAWDEPHPSPLPRLGARCCFSQGPLGSAWGSHGRAIGKCVVKHSRCLFGRWVQTAKL